jgi:HTH-type transcriptional regulator/antitoxin HigA
MKPESENAGPTPPGEMIRAELKRRDWTQEDLAKIIGKPTPRVNELIQGKLAVSPEIAAALGAAFGSDATVWIQAEAAYRLFQVKTDTGEVERRARLFSLAPVKDLERRGWIRPGGDISIVEQDVLRLFDISSLDEEPSIHGAMRKTPALVPATPAQKAWAARVRQLARAVPAASIGKYDEAKLEACRRDLRKLAAYSAEVRKVPGLLMRYGIRFVAVEGLPGAKMDGFATWLDNDSPVIGMSLRYDRLDSFWFTLGHELAHIGHRDVAPIDADVSGHDELPLNVKPPMERRADAESAAMFVPPDELESFIVRVGPLYSTERINQFAIRIKMHPNIIIGQLKHRGQIRRSAHNRGVPAVREAVVKAAVTDGWGKVVPILGE